MIIIFERGGGIRFLGLQAKKKGGVGWGGVGWGGVGWGGVGWGGVGWGGVGWGGVGWGGVGWGGVGWGGVGVEGRYFMPVEWDPRPAIAQTLAPEQGPQQPSPNQGHRRPYNGTFHLCL